MLRLLLLFTLVPALELWLLLQIGSWMGATQTFLLIVVTGTLGAWLAKQEGLGVLTQLREELKQGIPGGSRLVEGALVVVGGLLLLTPGVMTDMLGFALIAPPTRRWIAPRLLAEAARRIDVRATVGGTPDGQQKPANDPFANPFDDLP